MTVLAPSITIGGTTVSASTIDEIRIDYGRQSPNETCRPSSASITVFSTLSVQLGQTVSISMGGNVRFLGVIDSINMGYMTTSITATSSAFGVMARTYCNAGMSSGQPTWLAGFQPSCTLATNAYWFWTYVYAFNPEIYNAITFTYTTTDTMTTNWQAQTGTSDLLTMMHAIAANDAGAYVIENPGTTTIKFCDSQSRATTDAWTLPASSIIKNWNATKSYQELVNQVGVSYWTSFVTDWASMTNTASTLQTDSTSVSTYGLRSATYNSYASDGYYAERIASTAIAHGSTPRYTTSPVTVDVQTLDAGTTTNLMAAVCGTRIATPFSTYIPSFPSSCYIEGWSEHITSKTHFVDLYVSDVYLSMRGERWNEVNVATTYATVGATLTWLNLITNWI